jgi:hypothetical protein
MRRGHESPRAKAIENNGLKCGSEKNYPLPVNGYPYDKEPEACGSRLKILQISLSGETGV